MSIYIDMKMPDNCFECPFMYARRYCVVNSKIEFNDADYSELSGRYKGCPLFNVPPHGDLIDRDAMINLWDGCKISGSIKPLLEVRPVVIPASSGESREV